MICLSKQNEVGHKIYSRCVKSAVREYIYLNVVWAKKKWSNWDFEILKDLCTYQFRVLMWHCHDNRIFACNENFIFWQSFIFAVFSSSPGENRTIKHCGIILGWFPIFTLCSGIPSERDDLIEWMMSYNVMANKEWLILLSKPSFIAA